MKTLDRYILRQFFTNFVILLVVLSTLFVAVDVIINLDTYLRIGQAMVDKGDYHSVVAATLVSVFDVDAPMVLLLYVFFSGLVVVAGMGFTFAAFYRAGELIAVVSSGVSMYRIAASVLVAGFILNALALPSQEYVIPRLAGKLVSDRTQASLTTVQPFEVRYARDSHGSLLSAARFNPAQHTLSGVSILVRSAEGLALQRITASEATWSDDPQGWKLVDGRAIEPRVNAAPGLPGAAAVDRAGTPDPLRGSPVGFFATELSPTILQARQASFFPRLLSLHDLEDLSQSSAIDRDQIRQIMHSRFSLLMVNMLILVMGLPFFLVREPANMLRQGVKAAVVTLSAWGGALVLLQVGTAQLNPVADAWLPVVIYLPASALMLLMIKT